MQLYSVSGLKKTNAEPQEPKDYFQQVLEMEAFELYLPPIKPQYNRKTGQFLKGHEPHNKGKSWEEWMSKRGRRKASKGWKNLQLHPARNHPRLIEMQKKKLVAVTDDSSLIRLWNLFPFQIQVMKSSARMVPICVSNASSLWDAAAANGCKPFAGSWRSLQNPAVWILAFAWSFLPRYLPI